MNNLAFLLFFEFFKIGLFTYGGGYASLPFLYELCENYTWFNLEELTQLIAIAGLTPGPVGLNMATFAGYKTLALKGSIIASIALLVPMLIITSQVFRLYNKFLENKYIKSILYFLKPTSIALITSVGIKLFNELIISNKDFWGLILIVALFICTFKLKRDPIIYLFIAGIFGIILFQFYS